jgi:ATP-binding cassette subfamily B (MDR/TAP) protein 1
VIPLLVVGAALMGRSMQASATKGQDAYAKAGSIAEQIITGIRTVVAFGGEQSAVKRYVAELDDAYHSGKKKAFVR